VVAVDVVDVFGSPAKIWHEGAYRPGIPVMNVQGTVASKALYTVAVGTDSKVSSEMKDHPNTPCDSTAKSGEESCGWKPPEEKDGVLVEIEPPSEVTPRFSSRAGAAAGAATYAPSRSAVPSKRP